MHVHKIAPPPHHGTVVCFYSPRMAQTNDNIDDKHETRHGNNPAKRHDAGESPDLSFDDLVRRIFTWSVWTS